MREKLGPHFGKLMSYNPVTGIVESFRAAVSPERSIPWESIGVSLLVVLVLFFVGAIYFRKAERDFADTI